jgi:hypothetical protein
MARRGRRWLVAAALAACAAVPASAGAAVDVVTLLGTGEQKGALFHVDVRAPAAELTPIPVTGLGAGEVLRGIDYRPANGLLYGIATAPGNLVSTYTIVPTTGVATLVGTATVANVDGATTFGMSFDAVADRIRVIDNLASDGPAGNTNNFRLNPVSGARADFPIADSDLDFTALPGGNTSAPAVALAHHVGAGATTATTYALTVGGLDLLVRLGGVDGSPSPNLGSLQNVGFLLTGAESGSGLDIDQATGIGYAVLPFAGMSRVFSVNLATGAARPTALDNRAGATPMAFTALAIPPRPAIAFAPGSPSAAEGGAATVTVTRTGSLLLGSSVRYAVRPGPTSSAAGVDYAPTAGVLSFAPGEGSKAVQVPTVEDAAVEGDETVEIELSDPTGADLAATVATLTITDDDTAPPASPDGPAVYAPPTAPVGVVSLGDQRIDRSLAATVSCDQACRATLVLRLGRRTLAIRRVDLTAPGRRGAALALTRAEVALLRNLARGPRTVLLRLTATLADGDGRTRAVVAARLG